MVCVVCVCGVCLCVYAFCGTCVCGGMCICVYVLCVVCICVVGCGVCMCVMEGRGFRIKKRLSDSITGTGITSSYEYPTWVLGTKFGSSIRKSSSLNKLSHLSGPNNVYSQNTA